MTVIKIFKKNIPTFCHPDLLPYLQIRINFLQLFSQSQNPSWTTMDMNKQNAIMAIPKKDFDNSDEKKKGYRDKYVKFNGSTLKRNNEPFP